MNQQTLQSLFPKGKIKSTNKTTGNDLVISVEQGYFHIPKHDLSEREISLITELLINKQPTKINKTSIWYDMLFNNAKLPASNNYFRVIQIKLRNKNENRQEWLTHFSKLLDFVVDYFFIDETTAILIEQKTPILNNKNDIQSILLTLEIEFFIQSTVFLGQFNLISPSFIECFNEEQAIFNTFYKEYHTNQVFTFSDVALKYLTKKAIKDSSLMTNLSQRMTLDDDTVQVIKTLWGEQGNITSSAKLLYVHRNTLQYKLDKFSEQTGISLKNMTELTLCYLLILSL
ncbi:helix-turn-helix domain-containing protein [Vagococcus sp. JNUCC 83]